MCPFHNLPEPKNARRGIALTAEVMKRCRRIKPKLVAQVEFAQWTDADHLRHARFLNLRDDKEPREVTRESVGRYVRQLMAGDIANWHLRLALQPWRACSTPRGSRSSASSSTRRAQRPIEINGSFYSLQRRRATRRWYGETPAEFLFAVKGSRFITHIRKLRDFERGAR